MKQILQKVRRGGGGFIARPYLVLLVIFLFNLSTNILVLSLDKSPLTIDQVHYYRSSVFTFQRLRAGEMQGFIRALRLDEDPPLHRLLALPFYVALGPSPDAALLSISLSTLLLVFSVYWLGEELNDKHTGLVAAAAIVLMPGVFAFSRVFYMELTLTAAVALSLALMLKTKLFSNRLYTFLFGLSITIGLLAKGSYTLFIIGPFMVYAYLSLREAMSHCNNPWSECARRAAWLAFSLLVGLAFASLYYLPNLGQLLRSNEFSILLMPGPYSPFAFQTLAFYLEVLWTYHLGPVLCVVVLLACIFLLVSRPVALKILAPAFIIPYFFFTFVVLQNKAPRFVIPWLPAFAVLLALGITTPPKRIRAPLIVCVLIAGLLQLIFISFFSSPTDPATTIHVGLRSYNPQDWEGGLDRLVDLLNTTVGNRVDPFVANFIVHDFVYQRNFPLYEDTGELVPTRLTSSPLCQWDWIPPPEFYEGVFSTADVVIINPSVLGDSTWGTGGNANPPLVSRTGKPCDLSDIRMAWNRGRASYGLRGMVTFPDETRIAVFERNTSSVRIPVGQTVGPGAILSLRTPRGYLPTMLYLFVDDVYFRQQGGQFTVSINGRHAVNVSPGWGGQLTFVAVPIPQNLPHDGTLAVGMNATSPLPGEYRIELIWFASTCEELPECVLDWALSQDV